MFILLNSCRFPQRIDQLYFWAGMFIPSAISTKAIYFFLEIGNFIGADMLNQLFFPQFLYITTNF